MASNEQLTRALTDLLDEGVRGGVLSRADADRRLRAAGVEVEAPARTVTITAQVRGNVDALGGYGAETVRAQVEQALGGVARQVGLTVVPGQTRVTVG